MNAANIQIIIIIRCKLLKHAALTEDGHETQFQVNHLSHLLLTLELLPIMLDTASSTGDGRIVNLTSYVHSSGVVNPENMDGQKTYGRYMFYCNSKLYNVCYYS